jgi:hypothetical protein
VKPVDPVRLESDEQCECRELEEMRRTFDMRRRGRSTTPDDWIGLRDDICEVNRLHRGHFHTFSLFEMDGISQNWTAPIYATRSGLEWLE